MISLRSYNCLFLTALCFVFIAGLFRAPVLEATQEDFQYTPPVELTKVKYLEPKAKSKAAKGSVEFTFNLHPKVPTGAKVEFEIIFKSRIMAKVLVPVRGKSRKALTYVWKPKKALPLGTNPDYRIMTSLPPEKQTKAVKTALGKLTDIFPKAEQPWPMSYPKVPVRIGSEADLKAEQDKITKIFINWTDSLLDLNYEFADLCDEVLEGKKFVDSEDLDRNGLANWVNNWQKKMADLQTKIRSFQEDHPDLFSKCAPARFLTEDLSKMVAKRAMRTTLGAVTKKYKTTVENLRLKKVKGFDANLQRGQRYSPAAMKLLYDQIAQYAKFPKPEDEEAKEKKEEDESDAEGSSSKKKGSTKKSSTKKKTDTKKGSTKKSSTKKKSSSSK